MVWCEVVDKNLTSEVNRGQWYFQKFTYKNYVVAKLQIKNVNRKLESVPLKNCNNPPTEAAFDICSSKQVFLKIFTEKYLCWNFFFNNVAGFRPASLFRKKSPTQVFFFVNITKFLRTVFYRTFLVGTFATLLIQM